MISNAVQTVRAAFPFEVEKRKLQGPNGEATPFYGLFRTDTGESIGRHAPKAGYVGHDVDDVAICIEAASIAMEGCQIQCNWNGSAHQVWCQPEKSHRLAVFGKADNIWPRITLHAGYDGRKFRFSIGWYRDICKNMHIPQSLSEMHANVSHTRNMRNKLGELVEQVRELSTQWDTLKSLALHWEATKVDPDEYLTKVFGKTTGNKFADARTEKIMARIRHERVVSKRPANAKYTLWEVFNAVQGFAQHDRNRTVNADEVSRAFAVQLDVDVARAFEIAMALAA
jgi:hypothetical protein